MLLRPITFSVQKCTGRYPGSKFVSPSTIIICCPNGSDAVRLEGLPEHDFSDGPPTVKL